MTGSLIAVPVGLAAAGPIAELTSTSAVLIAGALWVTVSGLVMAALPSSRIAVASTYNDRVD